MPRTTVPFNLEAFRGFVLLSGHTAASLAVACDPQMDRSTVSNILAGTRNPSPDTLKRLMAALNLPMTAALLAPVAA